MTDRRDRVPRARLETTDGLAPASLAVRERLASLAEARSFSLGEPVLAEGQPTPFLGLVAAGRVALRLRVPDHGAHLTLATIETGELLGWTAVVPPYRATVDAIAIEPTTIQAWPAPDLRRALAADPELAAGFLPIVLETVSRRLTASWHLLPDALPSREVTPW